MLLFDSSHGRLLNEAAGSKPGVENMLAHAPTPLTASGLDIHDGHPAA